MPGIRLRPSCDADAALLYRIYASTRADELALTEWPDAAKEQFLHMQFQARQAAYGRHFPAARCDLIEIDGEPAGRLLVDRREAELAVIDIALLPEHRGHGIGTEVLQRLLDAARGDGLDVTLSVEVSNRAAALYRRLGFVEIDVQGLYRWMRFRATQRIPCVGSTATQHVLA